MDIYIYIYFLRIARKIIRRGKSYVGENYTSGKIIRRGKLYVGENYTWGKIVRRGKFSSRKIICRRKMANCCHFSLPRQTVVTFPRRFLPR